MSGYIDLDLTVEPDEIEQETYEQIATDQPGWEPSAGQPEVWLIKIFASWFATLAELGVDLAAIAFAQIGQQVFGVPLQQALPAHAITTWTMIDDAGYTISAGTEVSIPISGDSAVGFAVTQDVAVPMGSTATEEGEVVLEAVIAGEQGNGLSPDGGDPQAQEALAFVESITLEAVTDDGVDAQTEDEYLDALREQLKLLNFSPVLPEHVATVVRSIPGAARVYVLDLYDPETDTYDNEKTLTFAAVDSDGAAVSTDVKDAGVELLSSLRESNFVFHAIDPTSTEVAVSAAVALEDGFSAAAVQISVSAAIADFLSPAKWGTTSYDVSAWRSSGEVRRRDLEATVKAVPGVYYVDSLTLGEEGDTLGTDDLELDGAAPITAAGTISVTTV